MIAGTRFKPGKFELRKALLPHTAPEGWSCRLPVDVRSSAFLGRPVDVGYEKVGYVDRLFDDPPWCRFVTDVADDLPSRKSLAFSRERISW